MRVNEGNYRDILYEGENLRIVIDGKTQKHCDYWCPFHSVVSSSFCLLNIEAPDKLETTGEVLRKSLRSEVCLKAEAALKEPKREAPRRV